MDRTVDGTIAVDVRATSELRDVRTRDAIGRLVGRVLRRERQAPVEKLLAAIERLSTVPALLALWIPASAGR